MKNCLLILVLLTLLSGFSQAQTEPAISDIDRIRIAEVYRVGEKLQDRIWSGWSKAPFGMLFIADDHEFLIRHPKPSEQFRAIGFDKLLKSEVFVRPRVFQKGFLATFPAFDRTPLIVVGKAENTSDKTSTRWVFVVLHEHFHQLQYSGPDYFDEVGALNLARGDATGMWQITYPFPYKDREVADALRLLADKLLAAYDARKSPESKTGLLEYLELRQEFAATLSADDYRYASFQLWQEGIARYTQFRIAELAARELKPSRRFRNLPDFTTFRTESNRLLDTTLDELKKLDLAEWERTVFYPYDAVEGLLLDEINPDWHDRYFLNKYALEKYYPVK